MDVFVFGCTGSLLRLIGSPLLHRASGCYSLVAVSRLLVAVASLVAGHKRHTDPPVAVWALERRLSNCGTWV